MIKQDLAVEREQRVRLELIEGDLLHKLACHEQDLAEAKARGKQMELDMAVRGEAIEKAQRVIERMQEEMDKGNKVISEVERENRGLRERARETGKSRDKELKKKEEGEYRERIRMEKEMEKMADEMNDMRAVIEDYKKDIEQERTQIAHRDREAYERRVQAEKDWDHRYQVQTQEINQLEQELEGARSCNQEL